MLCGSLNEYCTSKLYTYGIPPSPTHHADSAYWGCFAEPPGPHRARIWSMALTAALDALLYLPGYAIALWQARGEQSYEAI